MGSRMRGTTSARRLKLVGTVLFIVATIGVAGPGGALAAAPSTTHGTSAASDQYATPTNAVAGTSGSGGDYTPPAATPVAATSSTGGTLPFTGMSLMWPAVGAVALVGVGLA